MAFLGDDGFDSTGVEPAGKPDPLPAGTYRCVCVASEWKETRSGDGKYIQFDWQVIDGEHTGRRVSSRLNLHNASDKAVQIARSELSSICHACNVLHPRDTSELHDIPIQLKVAVKGEYNEVKGYAPDRGAKPQAASKPSWM